MLIRDVRPWGGSASDVVIEDGRIGAVRPHDRTVPLGAGDVDGRGRLLLPSFSDVHVHLDSTRLGLPFREHTGAPGVWAMMLNDRAHWRNTDVPHAEIVAGTLERMIARGTTRVRSYAQVDVDCKLEKFDSVMAAKEKFAGAADVQVMTFPQAGILLEEGTVDYLEESLRQGADVMGGIDPSQLDRDPVRHLDIVFGLAEKYQVEVDIHLHEPGHLGVFSTELVLERVRALGMQGKVTMSHAYELGGVDEATSRRLIEAFAELDIAMASVAPAARNQLRLVDLVSAGVRFGLGEDGQRDYWSPYGNADMLDRTWQLAFTNSFRRDEHIEMCLAVATMGGAAIMSHDVPRLTGVQDRPGTAVGDRADLLIVDGETPTSAVMDRGTDRTVLHDGRVVADGLRVLAG
ncbi:amidohydrolase family protein [Microbacterium azadirachtae]|uniref:N-isopropylammelide isopropyl amidohydrolase n=1 Tax=Microbacterium azadirachtae TaxID=582680 RepID=A0A0F0KJL9_9MICO|nr:amidohydrolase family protein [Microbacterium azadirachtae]KJL19461.1 N-isopropylammelide isopropyl amidohydrolase [Microbacterium azadirachtae]UXW84670.1 amidohydrolase family protein [Microbacterium azadirachtae]SDL42949.1 Cytosine/adenosine deaminase [Microbacterium azadirachtae]SEF73478.1 Cytosine/adenosine deaminase [Microbacterium azadirachtae]SEF74134.1 Cytosine/adenosine deaminase [Microbacterium azadirachtae]